LVNYQPIVALAGTRYVQETSKRRAGDIAGAGSVQGAGAYGAAGGLRIQVGFKGLI
jgi:hypothetical protein